MINYKIIYKMYKGRRIIAYKIYAGVFVFMVSPDLLRKGIKAGIIEPSDNIPKFTYDNMCCIRGREAEYRLDYALKHSSLDYLKESLSEVNSMGKIISFDYLFRDNLIFKVSCNIETNEVLNFEAFDNFYKNMRRLKTAFGVIDFLIDNHMDRDFMNSRNIITKVKENKGREISCSPCLNATWVRFEEDKHLTFADVAYDFEL